MPSTRLEILDGVATITFDHVERRNAMTLSMWRDLRSACATIAVDDLAVDDPGADAVKAVVLTGAGTDAFVAGADISQFEEARNHPEDQSAYNATVNGSYADVAALPQPTVAKIRGACVGGGVGIAVSADIRIASTDAVFAVPPARLGIGYPPEGVASLVHLIGPAWTTQLLYTSDLVDAPTALRIGLVNEVVEPGDLDDRVDRLVSTIAARAPLSQRAAKLSVSAAYDPEGRRRRRGHGGALRREQRLPGRCCRLHGEANPALRGTLTGSGQAGLDGSGSPRIPAALSITSASTHT